MGTLKELLRVNDWMVKVDLKDAYFTVPIHPDYQPLLRFQAVHLPTLWPVLCTMGIHQSDEANYRLSLKYVGLHDCLYRRHSFDGRVSGPCKGSLEHPGAFTGWSGVYHQSDQVKTQV